MTEREAARRDHEDMRLFQRRFIRRDHQFIALVDYVRKLHGLIDEVCSVRQDTSTYESAYEDLMGLRVSHPSYQEDFREELKVE